jgi:hypothetical protein
MLNQCSVASQHCAVVCMYVCAGNVARSLCECSRAAAGVYMV